MVDNVKKIKLLREGFSEELLKESVQLMGTWVAIKAVHQSDLSDIQMPIDVDYTGCVFHEVVKVAPLPDCYEGPLSLIRPGVWVVVIRNALDGLSANKQFVVCSMEDVVMVIDPASL